MEHYVKNFPLPPIQKFLRHEGVGPSEKNFLLAAKPADRQIRKSKVHSRNKYNLICIFLSYGYKLMSQDSREKFGVKTQISIGGGVGGRGEKERKERKDMLKAGQSRGSIVCVSVNYKAK